MLGDLGPSGLHVAVLLTLAREMNGRPTSKFNGRVYGNVASKGVVGTLKRHLDGIWPMSGKGTRWASEPVSYEAKMHTT